MAHQLQFALNHMAAPRLDTPAFLDLAASLGCAGVELRNDLADKKLADREFFDGRPPAIAGDHARAIGLRLLGLSEAYGFNKWSDEMEAKVALLIRQARQCGAESISLIPLNDGSHAAGRERLAGLISALANVRDMLSGSGIIALVEPLGFETSSLRHKSEAMEAIAAAGGLDCFKLVHDTFHHHLAHETDYYPEHTGIVHISGIVEEGLDTRDMQDGHRILVDERDRLGNVAQIAALSAAGYRGAFSFEPFSPLVHASPSIEAELAQSMDFIRTVVNSTAV